MKLTNVFFSHIFYSSSFVMVVANYNILNSSLPPAFCIFTKKAGGWISSRLKRLLKHLHTHFSTLCRTNTLMHIQYLWFSVSSKVFGAAFLRAVEEGILGLADSVTINFWHISLNVCDTLDKHQLLSSLAQYAHFEPCVVEYVMHVVGSDCTA